MRSGFRHFHRLTTILLFAFANRALGLDPSLSLNQFIHTSWNGTSGFAIPGVWGLAQTADGYLWLGTEQGLLRFDGVRFVRWKPATGEELPGTAIASLARSANGGLWIGMTGAIVRLHDGRLERYTPADGVPNRPIIAMVEDRAGRLWAGCVGSEREGLIRIENGAVTTFGRNQGLRTPQVLSLFLDGNDSLWLGTAKDLCRWNGKTAEACRPTPSGAAIRSMASGAEPQTIIQTIIAGTEKGLLQFRGGNAEPVPLPMGQSAVAVRTLLTDREATLWAGTVGAGLFRLHNGRVEHYTRLDGLSSDVIHTLFEDREGTVWVGTQNGLERFREPKVARWSTGQGLAGNVITAIGAAHEGGVWVGVMDRGLNRIRQDSVEPGSPKAGTEGVTVMALCEDAKGKLWAGTARRFGYISQNRFTEVLSPEGGHLDRVFAITAGPEDTLWMADARRGVLRMRNRRVETVAPARSDAGRVYQLLADQAGNLWIGYYEGGLDVARDGRVHSYTARDGLAPGSIQSIYEDRSGTIWVGTKGGLSRFRKDRWTTWTDRQGLPPGGVQASIQDGFGHLWLITGSSLLRAEMADLDRQPDQEAGPLSLSTYGPSDGIRLAESAGMMNPRIALSGDGRLWFSTEDGLAGMNPSLLRKNALPPPVVVEQLTVDGKPVAIGPGEIGLSSHSVEFDYTALSLTLPEAVRFRYQLEGFDKAWIDAGNRRQIAYANLPARHYRFHVIASNNDGVWNMTGASVAFRCEPYFYQTWWFLTFCAAAAGLFGYSVYRYRLGQLRSRFQLVLDERARLARELHDTLLQGFTGVVFQLEAGSRQLASAPEAGRRRIQTALEQADQSLKEARQALSCMRLPTLENTPLPEALAVAARQIVDGTSIRFHMEMKGKARELPYEVQANLFIIAREAMTNAMNHARPANLSLELEYAENWTRLAVRDDGIGFAAAAAVPKEGHFGLNGMRERARRIAGKLTVESSPGKGTKVEIRVPNSK